MKKPVLLSFLASFVVGLSFGSAVMYLSSLKDQRSLATKYHSLSSEPNRSPDVQEGTLTWAESVMLQKTTVQIKGSVGTGTGFRAFDENFIVSNAHVVDDCVDNICNVFITSNPDRGEEIRVPAQVVAIDDLSDLSILKFMKKVSGPYLPLGSIKNINIYKDVIHFVSLGFPEGRFELFYHDVSNLGKDPVIGNFFTGQKKYKYYTVVSTQTLKGGASGSPVLHRTPEGEIKVLSVISAGGEGINLSIAADHVTRMMEDYQRVLKDYEERKDTEPNYNPFPVETHSYISVERDFLKEKNPIAVAIEAQRLFNEGNLVEAYPLVLEAAEQGDFKALEMLSEYDKRKGDCRKLRPAPKEVILSRRAELPGADLHCVYFEEANLQEANLENANLKQAVLREVDLKGANLKGADLRGADLFYSNFHVANLEGANLQKTNLLSGDFRGANLKNADLRNAELGHANLQRADLRGAKLKGARLQGVKLQNAKLQGADFNGAELGGIVFERVNLEGVNFKGVNFFSEDLSGMNFEGMNFEGAELGMANLSHVNFKGANLKKSNLGSCNCEGVNFQKAGLEEVDFYRVNLREANFQGANLKGAKFFSSENLQGAIFKDANLQGADFSRANLQGADFRGANLSGTIFKKASNKKRALFDSSDFARIQNEDRRRQ